MAPSFRTVTRFYGGGPVLREFTRQTSNKEKRRQMTLGGVGAGERADLVAAVRNYVWLALYVGCLAPEGISIGYQLSVRSS
jgi:hypothetical protein